jgi:hypothetical protein
MKYALPTRIEAEEKRLHGLLQLARQQYAKLRADNEKYPLTPYEYGTRRDAIITPLREAVPQALDIVQAAREEAKKDYERVRNHDPLTMPSTYNLERAAYLRTLLAGFDRGALMQGAKAALDRGDVGVCAAYVSLFRSQPAVEQPEELLSSLEAAVAPERTDELATCMATQQAADELEEFARLLEERAEYSDDVERNKAAMLASGEYSKF